MDDSKAFATAGLFCTATLFVFLPICRPALHAYEIAPVEPLVFFAGSAVAIGFGLCVTGGVRKLASKIAVRRRRLKALAALPPARTRREKLEGLKSELEAAEKAERDRLEEEGRKIEAESPAPTPPVSVVPVAPSSGTCPGGNVLIYNGNGLVYSSAPEERMRITGGGELLLGRGQVPFDSEDDQAPRPAMPRSVVGSLNWLYDKWVGLDANCSQWWNALDRNRKRIDGVEERLAKRLAKLEKQKEPSVGVPFSATPSNGLRLVPLPHTSPAGRARKEPVWERRVFTTRDYDVRFFSGGYTNKDGSQIQTNMHGMNGCLPPSCHLFWYSLAVRFDEKPMPEWLACSKISFEFATSRLLSLPLGVVYDAGIEGRSVAVMDKPVEINALEAFTVRIETQGYTGPDVKVGMTVSLNGLLIRGIS